MRNKDHARAYQHEYYIKHKEETRQRRLMHNREYYERHKDRVLTQKKQYRQERLELLHEAEHKRRKPYSAIYIENGGEMVCNRCGSTTQLQIHHKNGDHEDNDFKNLECLCDSCHGKEHNRRRIRDEKGRYTPEVAKSAGSL